MRLADGAEAIRGDLPSSLTTTVEVPLEAGDERGTGVHRFGSLQIVRDRVVEALAPETDVVLTIGGDCGVEAGAIDHALRMHPATAVVWFDAHPDLNTPESSESGAFTGMVLRTLMGEGPAPLVPVEPLAAARVVLAGTRETDPGEDEFLASAGVRTVPVEALDSPDELVAAVRASGATSVYIHINLDVLDPAELEGLENPSPFGISAAALAQSITALRAEFALAGGGITMFSPADAESAAGDMAVILRLISAFTRGGQSRPLG
jgi:arginase